MIKSKHYKLYYNLSYKKSYLSILIKKNLMYYSVCRNNIINIIKNIFKFYEIKFFGFDFNIILYKNYNYNLFLTKKYINILNIVEIFNLFNNFILLIKC